MMKIWTVRGVALLLASALVAAGEPPKKGPPAAEKPDSSQEADLLNVRMADLIKQLGSPGWAARQEAGKALVKIGWPAEPAVSEASRSADPEVSVRAAEVLRQIQALPRRRKVDPNCTDGYQPVCEGIRLVQTFKAPADQLEAVRFRAARTFDVPWKALTVELREPGREAPLATAAIEAEAATAAGSRTGVTRFYQWFRLGLKDAKIEKGKTYELVFGSETPRGAPWLVNCFYRDTYPDGELNLTDEGKAVKSDRKFDVVFEAVSDAEVKATSAPEGADLTRKDESFGLAPDGTDRSAKTPEIRRVLQLPFGIGR